ncbi:RHS repeat-associated core domain-containing protein [Candidatus Uabimicrobium sp. HlEnr_7]|uniref:RHS repeat-associated core domain-containing protein n=1 Tax=Candidatus Uabimicrobium helgolandensis TaxID=3095367 RepID=UPI003557BD16
MLHNFALTQFYTYSREEVNPNGNPNDVDLPREVTTIVDRNQNITIMSYNINGNLVKKEEKTRGIRPSDPQSFITMYKYTATGLLKETIHPEGNRVVREYDENNPDQFQRGNLISVTHFPDAARGGDQQFHKVSYTYEPFYNQLISVTEQRGNDPSFQPQNGGIASSERYTSQMIPDYFEANLDTVGCTCGFTLQDLIDKFGIDASSVLSKIGSNDLNGDGITNNVCGNIIVEKSPIVNLRTNSPQTIIEGGTQQFIEIRKSYNKFGQLSTVETPEGEVSLMVYNPETDPDGDGVDVQSGNKPNGDEFDIATGGYLQKTIVDHSHSTRYRGNSLPTQISSEYGYDSVGNVVFTINPRGVKTLIEVNALNQIVETTVAADVSAATEPNLTAFAYKTRLFYDANNNLIKSEVEYRDGNNPDLPNFIETTTTYDILDKPLSITQRVDNNKTLTTEMRYDANENLVEVKSPLAVSGIDPDNITRTEYDERDLVHKVIQAPGTTNESIVTSNYNLNGNPLEIIDAEDTDGDGQNEKTLFVYDGFNRRIRTIDSVGNVVEQKFDPASNIIEVSSFGPIGEESKSANDTTGNVLLSRSHVFHDELSRVFKTEDELFISQGVNLQRVANLDENDATPGDGLITSFVDYDRNSRTVFTTSASPNTEQEITKIEYDGASRVIRVEDALSNTVTTQYDQSSNPLEITVTEVHSTGRIASESFTTINVFDSLNRKIRTTNNIGQTNYFFYDSRNMLTRAADSEGTEIADSLGLFAGNINDLGNISEVVQDGLGRTIKTIKELTVDGEGGNPLDLSNPSNIDGNITETSIWDDNSRLLTVQDDNSNTTTYEYDNLNRPTKTIFADGKSVTNTYSKDHNIISHTDNNGNVCTYVYDGINRIVEKNIARSVTNNIVGTTQQTFQFDGLSRLTVATDNNNPSDTTDDSIVVRNYDSLSRMLEEIQNGKTVSMNWREKGDLTECIYPNDRKITYNYDKIDRLTTINENSTAIASYDYIGSRVIERIYKNGTKLTMLNDAGDANVGYDNARRLVHMRHLRPNNNRIQEYEYTYNRVNFKTQKKNLHRNKFSERYQLDSLYRVTDFKRGRIKEDGSLGGVSQTQDWQFDGVGNWAKTTVNGQEKTQTINNMNEYDSFDGTTFVHDDNGNLTDDSERLFAYDALNRITEIKNKASDEVIATYKYDFMNRRINKQFREQHVEECSIADGEAIPDANTLALYYYNNTDGPIVDSSGNGSDISNPKNTSREDGLFNTRSVRFNGQRLKIPLATTLDNIQDQLSVETFVFLNPQSTDNLQDVGGALIKRKDSFTLKLSRGRLKPVFILNTLDVNNEVVETKVRGNVAIPLATWVHIAGVYDGQSLKIFVNGTLLDEKPLIGNVVINVAEHTFLGSTSLAGNLEETRISNIARVGCAPGGLVTKDVRRSFFYSGWRTIEEREQAAEIGQAFGQEIVSRQFVDGSGIDEHLQITLYDETGTSITEEKYLHQNSRGDVVGVSDIGGNIVYRFEHSSYGLTYLVNSDNELEEFTDFEEMVYSFQGRRAEVETGGDTYYYRNRYYNPTLGRFLQRDGEGYVDGLGLYQAFAGNPYTFTDPKGKFAVFGAVLGATIDLGVQVFLQGRSFSQVNWKQTALAGGAGFFSGGVTGLTTRAVANGSMSLSRALTIDFLADMAIGTVQTIGEYFLDPQQGCCGNLWDNIFKNAIITSLFHSYSLFKGIRRYSGEKDFSKSHGRGSARWYKRLSGVTRKSMEYRAGQVKAERLVRQFANLAKDALGVEQKQVVDKVLYVPYAKMSHFVGKLLWKKKRQIRLNKNDLYGGDESSALVTAGHEYMHSYFYSNGESAIDQLGKWREEINVEYFAMKILDFNGLLSDFAKNKSNNYIKHYQDLLRNSGEEYDVTTMFK